MGLLTAIKSLFGEGKIRLEGTTEDGRTFVAKVPYVGDIDTLDETELHAKVRAQLLVEHGVRVTSLRTVGHC